MFQWCEDCSLTPRLLLILMELAIVFILLLYFSIKSDQNDEEAFKRGWIKVLVRYDRSYSVCWITLGTYNEFIRLASVEMLGRFVWSDPDTEFEVVIPDEYKVISKGRFYEQGCIFK